MEAGAIGGEPAIDWKIENISQEESAALSSLFSEMGAKEDLQRWMADYVASQGLGRAAPGFSNVTVADPVVAGSQSRPKPKFSPASKTRPQKAGLPMQTQFTLKRNKTKTTRNTKKFLATIYY